MHRVKTSNQKFKGFIADGMAFSVPSWKDGSPLVVPMGKGLAAPPPPDTSLVPDIFAHRFEEGRHQPIEKGVRALTVAKRIAAIKSLTKEISNELAIKAEQVVSSRRVDLLRTFITGENEHLCVESLDSAYDVTTSVNYRRLNKTEIYDTQEDPFIYTVPVVKMYQVQSPVSWNGSPYLKWVDIGRMLVNPKEPASELLTMIIRSSVSLAIKDESTKRLRALVNKIPTDEPLSFEYVAGGLKESVSAIWEPSEPTQNVQHAFTTEIETEGEYPVVFTVLIGVLDINCIEDWHNPLINEYVQDAVKRAGEKAIQEMSDPGCTEDKLKRWMWNILKPCIRISEGGDVHILTLSPFNNPDCCTVLHLHIKDEIHGLCELGSGSDSDHGGDHGQDEDGNEEITTEDADLDHTDFFHARGSYNKLYHCAGTNHCKRFNEQELNYIHSEAFNKNDEENGVTPIDKSFCIGPGPGADPDQYHTDSKSARISFTDWDVLVTSMDIENDEAKTIITLVNYPPPGARYARDPPGTTKKLQPGAQEFVPGDHAANGTNKRSREDMFKMNPSGGFTWKEPAREENHRKNSTWKEIPSMGHMYYIPGLHPNSFSAKEWHVWLIDTDAMQKETKLFMTEAIKIRDEIYAKYKDKWSHDYVKQAWMNNIEHNTEKPEGEEKTIREYYVHEWREFLRKWIGDRAGDSDEAYLYCEHNEIWHDILTGTSEVIEEFKTRSHKRYEDELKKGSIKPVVHVKTSNNTRSGRVVEKILPRHPYRHPWPEEYTPQPLTDFNAGTSFYIPGICLDEEEEESASKLRFTLFLVDGSQGNADTVKVRNFSNNLKVRLIRDYRQVWLHEENLANEPNYYWNVEKNTKIPEGKSERMLTEYVHEWARFIKKWIREASANGKTPNSYFYSGYDDPWIYIFEANEAEEMEEYKTSTRDRYNIDVKEINESDSMPQIRERERRPQPQEHHSVLPDKIHDNTTPHAQYSPGKYFFIPGLLMRGKRITMSDPEYNLYAIPIIKKGRSNNMEATIIDQSLSIMQTIHDSFRSDEKWVSGTAETDTREREILYNIQNNVVDKVEDMGIHQMYLLLWQDFLKGFFRSLDMSHRGMLKEADEMGYFLYCAEPLVWNKILDEEDEQTLKNAWIVTSNELFKENSIELPRLLGAARIALPNSLIRQEGPTHTELASTMSEMKERIQTLEARLTQTRQDENRDHLLKQVLAKLRLRNGP